MNASQIPLAAPPTMTRRPEADQPRASRARCRRPSASPSQVAPPLPEGGAQHPPAVERQRRDQVEASRARLVKPSQAPTPSTASGGRGCGDGDEDDAEHERDDRAGDGDAELRARPREHPLEAGHAAEQPERDALDLHPVALGLERMAQLVQEDRGEEGAATTAIAKYVPSQRPGFCDGKTPGASDQTMSANTRASSS